LSRKKNIASWSILLSPAKPTRRNAGTGFAQPTMDDYLVDPTRVYSSEAEVNPRLSRASLAKSLAGCRQERPLLPSWEQPTTIRTRQSVYILVSRAGLPRISPLRLSRCDKVDPIIR
jgi:hypothetical protein